MADWRDQLQPGSFRGVAFHVDMSRYTGGRRVVNHVFPKRDKNKTEDMGRIPRGFPLELFVIGRDYMTDRDILIDALEAPGVGTLIHPYYGNRNVAVLGEFEVTESHRFGGMARFHVPFGEDASVLQPAARVDTKATVVVASQNALQAATSAFTDRFSMAGLPDFSGISMLGGIPGIPGLPGLPTILGMPSLPGLPNLPSIPNLGALVSFGSLNGGLAGLVRAASSLVPGGSLVATGATLLSGGGPLSLASLIPGADNLTGFISQASGLSLNLSALIQDPLSLAGGLGGLINSFVNLVSGPRDAAQALTPMFVYSSGASAVAPAITVADFAALPSVTRQTEINVASVESFVRQACVITAVQAAATGGSFVSYDEAIDTRDTLVDAVHAITEAAATPMSGALSDDVYYAMTTLAAALVKDVAVRGAALPRLRTYTPPQTMPALVVAWRSSYDATRDLEIVERNAIVNPNFTPGGEALELLDV